MSRKQEHLANAEHAAAEAAYHRDARAIEERLRDCTDGEESELHGEYADKHAEMSARYMKRSVHHAQLARDENDELGEPLKTRKAMGLADGIVDDGVTAILPDAPAGALRPVFRSGQPTFNPADLTLPAPLQKLFKIDDVDSDIV